MIVQAEINEEGLLKITDPKMWGKKISLSFPDGPEGSMTGESNWEEIKKIAREADALDFPRRSIEEILRDIHEFRG